MPTKTIYLADDDPDDRFLIREAIKEVNPEIKIIETDNGLALLSLIREITEPESTLILLDMNMPKMNGLETITALRSDPTLPLIPAMMISTSYDHSLAEEAFRAGINGYMTKPVTYEGFIDMGHQLVARFLA
ncbi:Response regulator rcp1 [Dyadobacter sp. CECT 9275]|uniref:Response regulator rcp1 n=1 Tax=Dyadobacter helix TaxID=2822344 RepID=A0A916JJW5_9BACT|nr:response regulator [Dyadobacter sp. CECT 9275]CAG5018417.1 Response regulator rcp1 [Dyadobacter sp. CECT 9275]